MKLTPEIEAVARAIYEKRNGVGTAPFSRKPIAHKEPYYLDAVAAIRALREPTESMVHEGVRDLLLDEPLRDEDARSVFMIMIDAALGGNK